MRAGVARPRRVSACLWALVFVTLLFAGVKLARAQGHEERRSAYWLFLERGPSTSEHLTQAAVERRLRRGVRAAFAGDAAVRAEHLAVLEGMGLRPRAVSRWLQAVSIEASADQVEQVAALPFVRSIRRVGWLERTAVAPSRAVVSPLLVHRMSAYGPSREQLAVINAIAPLERGIDGRGVRLGFLDCTYGDFDHPAFESLRADGRLLAVRDFTGRSQGCIHGLSVASVAAGNARGQLVGPAHGASVLAAVTEYGPTETRSEEDYFVEGLEWLEAQGADVVNVSLGYTTFDPGEGGYARGDLDGDTGVTTRAVDAAAARGVTVVTSAGNSGCAKGPAACWFYISTPADADSAIAVGAVTMGSTLALFSARGPTVDGRIKPDVVAPGVAVFRAVGDTAFANGHGTSFSSPLVAGVAAQMLQVNPHLTPIDVRAILRETASQAASPDTLAGWGVVDAAAAVAEAERLRTPPVQTTFTLSQAHPNPFSTLARVNLTVAVRQRVRVEVIDVLGRMRRVVHDGSLDGGMVHVLEVSAARLAAGVYVLRVISREGVSTRQLVLVR